MKQILIFSIVCLGIACTGPKKATKNSTMLNGTWIPIRQELAGKDLTKAVFEKYRLVLQDSIYTYGGADVDQGVLYYKDDKMDIYGKKGINTGKHYTAIYKLENEQLVICYNLAGDVYPEAYETKSKPTLFISVYK